LHGGYTFAEADGVESAPKRFVYILKSIHEPASYYVGLTSNVRARLDDHNTGRCPHTVARRPWRLHVTMAFPDERIASRFERYLKSASGRAFAKHHFE
jgi:predicted GIY-YIG superfamily endonuclease